MQADSIKSSLKTPGAKRLKPKYGKLLSSFAFDFSLRRYSLESSVLFKPPAVDALGQELMVGLPSAWSVPSKSAVLVVLSDFWTNQQIPTLRVLHLQLVRSTISSLEYRPEALDPTP